MPGVVGCPFCQLDRARIVAENRLAVALWDGFPVNKGHTLVIPRRHVATWFEATAEEREAMLRLLDVVKRDLDRAVSPDGYNIGINVGAAAGQTVPHLHVHLIPRFHGDVDDPTGGVRLVIPERGNYRRPGFIPRAPGSTRPAALSAGGPSDPFLDHLAPLFARAAQIQILAAFVQDSGVRKIQPFLESALDRGARISLLTGDYLQITQERALRRLLDLAHGREEADGCFDLRVVEVAELGGRAFHPKSWIFIGEDFGTAFVGSSNLSESALSDGVEWNLRLDRSKDPKGFEEILREFKALWQIARVVDEGWLQRYAQRVRASTAQVPGEVEEERWVRPEPRDVQKEALAALRAAREERRTRALVVMATGLGKTWLAAFDIEQFQAELGRMPRVLFVAHRAEILRQAAATFRNLFPNARFSWYVGPEADLSGQFVFAAIQKISRWDRLRRLDGTAFDYVIVDEVHHADAETYRRLLAHLSPRFLLGLTATPERADAGDIFGLFDDFVAYRADIGVGIESGHLVSFRYWGLKDTVDYRPIPWRNGKFEPAQLERAVETVARMEKLWEAWQEYPGSRTLVFCVSISHAKFAARWLHGRGVRAVAVHSGPDSEDRAEALHALASGRIDAICTVDLFNEGVDIPQVDRVVMLRPTESPVVFLQQLGRGLRTAPGKRELRVIDFVGNHRVFLDRVRTLLSLGERATILDVERFLEDGKAPGLPPGCSVEIELEAVDLLRKLLPTGGDRLEIVRAYEDLRAARGARPTIGELYRLGFNPASLRSRYGSWFEFVGAQGDLSPEEQSTLERFREWFHSLEYREAVNKSYKLVALQAMLDAGALTTGMEVAENARRSLQILRRAPGLRRDLEGISEFPDPWDIDPGRWTTYWERWPLRRWAGEGRRRGSSRVWFRVHDGRFEPTFSVPEELERSFVRMTRELLDYRLAQYRRRQVRQEVAERKGFEARVAWNKRDPILMLPDRRKHPWIPQGETDVRLEDGTFWRFRFVKVAVNVARPAGSQRNQLPDLLRQWFGPAAGHPGTAFSVRFTPDSDGWRVEPVRFEGQAEIIPFPSRGTFVTFPSLRAAAGWQSEATNGSALDAEVVALPKDLDPDRHFVVRASGSSMAGWKSEIQHGDWLILRWARGEGIRTLKGRVVLIARGDPVEGQTFHLKRVVKGPSGYLLHSDNPEVPDQPARPDDQVVAVLVEKVSPESLAPPPGTRLAPEELPGRFGLSESPHRPWSRVDGHLFIYLNERGAAGSTFRIPGLRAHPGETAYVLEEGDRGSALRYLGVARWDEADSVWRLSRRG